MAVLQNHYASSSSSEEFERPRRRRQVLSSDGSTSCEHARAPSEKQYVNRFNWRRGLLFELFYLILESLQKLKLGDVVLVQRSFIGIVIFVHIVRYVLQNLCRML